MPATALYMSILIHQFNLLAPYPSAILKCALSDSSMYHQPHICSLHASARVQLPLLGSWQWVKGRVLQVKLTEVVSRLPLTHHQTRAPSYSSQRTYTAALSSSTSSRHYASRYFTAPTNVALIAEMSTGSHQNDTAPNLAILPPTDLMGSAKKQPRIAASQNEDFPAVKPSILDSSFPVLLPYDEALFMQQGEFDALVTELVGGRKDSPIKRLAKVETGYEPVHKAPFITGLEKHAAHDRTAEHLAKENEALTENQDVTYISSKDPLVDLFHDLGQNTSSDQLKSLLEDAWTKDPLTTLKIIFNARSIHLGKSSKIAAYKALGWLAENHPHTLLTNLVWLTRPVIEKKAPGASGDTDVKMPDENDHPESDLVILSQPTKNITSEDFDMIDAEEAIPTNEMAINIEGAHVSADEAEAESLLKAHDVRFGVSHGYYKDLLNILVFASNDQLKFDGDPSALLTQKQDRARGWRKRVQWDAAEAKAKRKLWRNQQNERVTRKLQEDPFYRALHLTVARIFAWQLQEDRKLLDSGEKSHLRNLSLAAKWAPSFGEFHDKWTTVSSSIAEILAPRLTKYDSKGSNTERETYLRHAREHFRREYTSPLRKALAVVERDIAAQTFSNIKYDRVPSIAMDRYSALFAKKDNEHFSTYIKNVAAGKARISGATLLPSKLVAKARSLRGISGASGAAAVAREVVDEQWKTLVQRIKDSGALSSSIAVCDVSGSMMEPQLPDHTTPLDAAIGLSLLVADVTAPPFGGGFITFSSSPSYVSIGGPTDTRGLIEKVRAMEKAAWGMSTNFTAVFEDVILPMALANKLTQDEMVKQIFVFSDMQFDAALYGHERWTSSYIRIQRKYADAGYEMPKLVFWNMADSSTDKPVTMNMQNTALLSGYSQGMLKVFLEGGSFEAEVDKVSLDEGNGDGTVVAKQDEKEDPLALVEKAVGHPAYAMLKVVD
ncbi:hypothetical protein DPSP01_012800 [Paraphaeosphaeria sporulosa]